ncbi:MAG: hypothetical protein JW743_05015 [Deltaproteobacteria bacterium]|nr:hypothetical protein [Deltaproteobacteria bacterium]MBN2846580.1 hypothetical protein [Deltaproteobacteria bacterium]
MTGEILIIQRRQIPVDVDGVVVLEILVAVKGQVDRTTRAVLGHIIVEFGQIGRGHIVGHRDDGCAVKADGRIIAVTEGPGCYRGVKSGVEIGDLVTVIVAQVDRTSLPDDPRAVGFHLVGVGGSRLERLGPVGRDGRKFLHNTRRVILEFRTLVIIAAKPIAAPEYKRHSD